MKWTTATLALFSVGTLLLTGNVLLRPNRATPAEILDSVQAARAEERGQGERPCTGASGEHWRRHGDQSKRDSSWMVRARISTRRGYTKRTFLDGRTANGPICCVVMSRPSHISRRGLFLALFVLCAQSGAAFGQDGG